MKSEQKKLIKKINDLKIDEDKKKELIKFISSVFEMIKENENAI